VLAQLPLKRAVASFVPRSGENRGARASRSGEDGVALGFRAFRGTTIYFSEIDSRQRSSEECLAVILYISRSSNTLSDGPGFLVSIPLILDIAGADETGARS
jgi:hypothetical protein